MNVNFKSHRLHIQDNHLDQLIYNNRDLLVATGGKTIEGISPGDWLTFNQSGEKFEVIRVKRYNSVKEALKYENYTRTVLGNCSKDIVETAFNHMFSEANRALGIFVLEIHKVGQDQLITLGNMATFEDPNLGIVLASVYVSTDFLNKDYPKRSQWYWSTFVPGLFTGERDGIILKINNKTAGVALIKKGLEEKKISTFVVAPDHQHNGVTLTLLALSFAMMGTETPVITINEKRLEDFKPIIERFNWQQTQILPPGRYSDRKREFVFNGEIV